MNVTSKEIAIICGISRGTVDRALNNRPGIKPETKEKILKKAKELGYRPHFLARSLVKGSTMTLGIVIFDINNRILAQIINSIETRARERGYFVYLTLTNKESEMEIDCINHLVDRKVDGIVLMSVNKGEQFNKYLSSLKTPIVTFGNRISEQFPFVWINDQKAIKEAVYYIYSKGYKEIIYVCPPLSLPKKENLYSPEQRFIGFKEACKEIKSIKTTIIKDKNYIQALAGCLTRSNSKKVILCTSDKYAVNILNFLKDKSINVPNDVGIMGFDNIDTLNYITPGLTTIAYPQEKIGVRIVDSLIEQIEGKQIPSTFLYDHKIVERESV